MLDVIKVLCQTASISSGRSSSILDLLSGFNGIRSAESRSTVPLRSCVEHTETIAAKPGSSFTCSSLHTDALLAGIETETGAAVEVTEVSLEPVPRTGPSLKEALETASKTVLLLPHWPLADRFTAGVTDRVAGFYTDKGAH